MRFRSTACVLGGILLAAPRAGLADSQGANLSIQVVVTRSCAISTPAAGGLSITCSRGPAPAVQSSTSLAAATAPTQLSLSTAAGSSAVTPQQRLSAAPAVAQLAAQAAAPAEAPSAALATSAEDVAAGGADPSGTVLQAGTDAADRVAEAPRQEILTINF